MSAPAAASMPLNWVAAVAAMTAVDSGEVAMVWRLAAASGGPTRVVRRRVLAVPAGTAPEFDSRSRRPPPSAPTGDLLDLESRQADIYVVQQVRRNPNSASRRASSRLSSTRCGAVP